VGTGDEIFAVLECHASYIGNYLPTFRDNLSGHIFIGCPETSMNTNVRCVTDLIYNSDGSLKLGDRGYFPGVKRPGRKVKPLTSF